MEEKYGQVFKDIRTGRGLSLQDATGGHFSQSMLSRFENGHSEMSVQKLVTCLDNIYLSLSEYDYLLKDFVPNEFYQLISQMHNYSFPFQKSALEALVVSELEKGRTDGREQYHRLNAIMIKAAIKSQDASYPISSEEMDYLSDYLFSMAIWIEYELLLFISTYSLFPSDVLVRYCQEMIQRAEIFQHSFVHSNLVQTILLNASFHLIDKKRFDSAQSLLNMFEDHFSETRDAYMRMIYRLALGYYQLHQTEGQGKELIAKTLEVMVFLGYQRQADYYREHFENYL